MTEEMTTIQISKRNQEHLLEVVFKVSTALKKRATYDDAISYLFTRELISLRQGE